MGCVGRQLRLDISHSINITKRSKGVWNMKQLKIVDMTLVKGAPSLSFKEKTEIARQLNKLNVDTIDLPEIADVTTDTLLIRTISAFVKSSTICVSTGRTIQGVKAAAAALSAAKKARLKINLPVSAVQMEYFCHKKADKMLALAKELFAAAAKTGYEVEFFAEDATRAEPQFLNDMVSEAVQAGVSVVTLCDDEGSLLPDEFAAFITNTKEQIPALQDVKLGVLCKNTNGMATASALMAIKAGVDELKCCVNTDALPRVSVLANILNLYGERIGVNTTLNYNELYRIVKQIDWISGATHGEDAANMMADAAFGNSDNTPLDSNDSLETVTDAVKALGYDLSDEDYTKVYEEFCRLATRKTVGQKDLEAIVASVALQVPPTYKLISYVINNGNIISASAQIKLEKNGEEISGICTGDGPVDASFRTLEQIIGSHFELDDFQIQAVTEGREAVGAALVRLRHNGKLFSGNGVSTDIIGSSIRAYINAVNKIVYEES